MESNIEKIIHQIDRMEITIMPIDSVRPDEKNPKDHSLEQIDALCRSMQSAWTSPIIIDENSAVIAGHGRLMAARSMGLAKVPCVVIPGLTDAEKIQLQIFDNKSAEMSVWNIENLCIKLDQLRDLDADISLTGFSDKEISEILDELKKQDDADEKLNHVPDLPKITQTKPGDIWTIGRHKLQCRHRLICGDATSRDDLIALMADAKANLMVTDPPYNVDISGSGTETKELKILNDNMSDSEFEKFVDKAMSAAVDAMNPGAAFYVWHGENASREFRNACDKNGLAVHETLIWVKNMFVMSRQDYHWRHEPCYYGWKAGAAHLWCASRDQSTVLEFDKPTTNPLHPTMKPIALIERLITNSSLRGQVILDPFGGSGTTMIAAERTGRDCRMAELSPEYCDVIVKRFLDTFGGIAIKQDGTEFKNE